MSNLVDITDAPLLALWGDTVRGRRIEGERLTLAVVELAPNATVPEHRHEQEQLGMVISGEVDFTVDGETRHLGPGGTWRCLSNKPHNINAGPDGAVVLDIFTPIRDDWNDRAIVEGSTPRWPVTG